MGDRWQTDGKFFRSGTRRVWMKAVTYGPFPGGMPESLEANFSQIAAAGFNVVRLYELPDHRLLNAAEDHGLKVFGGLQWQQGSDFLRAPGNFSAARVALADGLRRIGRHPALAGVYVGNEIPADLVRWMGPLRVRVAVEELISLGKSLAPHLLFAYANYPSTEYLEPENADFTAFNVYLESESAFRSYLKRLHHIAGDRPLVISEFGLDSRRHGLDRQAECLGWATQAAYDLETAGMTLYAWSDRWWNGGAEVLDWDFGLLDRTGAAKPALGKLAGLRLHSPPGGPGLYSVIVCTRNGRQRIGNCLAAIQAMEDSNFETVVVDDGSTDGTADEVAEKFPWVRLVRLEPSGLSCARNAGAAAACGEVLLFTDDDCEPDGEWIGRLRPAFAGERYAAVGGPNLPPAPRTWQEAVVRASPGAPSHVLLDDELAEHLPGCNLAVTREAFERMGGFDPQFQTAGDDVDFCWRLSDAGLRLGFVPGAFVWHWRRPSIAAFLRQQVGYGKAERLLLAKHPARFSACGDANWQGFVYGGGPVRVMEGSLIHFGKMGEAGYQAITNRMLPLRGLDDAFDSWRSRLMLAVVEVLQPRLRAWMRNRRFVLFQKQPRALWSEAPTGEFTLDSPGGEGRESFLNILMKHGWKPSYRSDLWDLEKYDGRVLMATERGNGGGARILVRYRGKDPRKSVTLLDQSSKKV
jgi:GT2 family glycosyltransferase